MFVWGFLNCCDITIFCWAHNNHKKTIFGKMSCSYNSTILLLSWTVEFEKNVKSWCIKVFLLKLIFYIYFITSFCNTWHDCVQNFEYNTRMCKAEFERASPIIMTQIGRKYIPLGEMRESIFSQQVVVSNCNVISISSYINYSIFEN